MYTVHKIYVLTSIAVSTHVVTRRPSYRKTVNHINIIFNNIVNTMYDTIAHDAHIGLAVVVIVA